MSIEQQNDVQELYFVPQDQVRIQKILSKGLPNSKVKSYFQDFKKHTKQKEIEYNPPNCSNSFGRDSPAGNIFILILIAIYVILIATGTLQSRTAQIVIGILLGMVYLGECASCKAAKELENIKNLEQFQQECYKMRTEKPIISIDVKSYHYKHSFKKNSSKKRIVTYTEQFNLQYSQAIDETQDIGRIIEENDLFRVENVVRYSYADQYTEYYFESMKKHAIHRGILSDSEYEQSHKVELPGLIPNMIVSRKNRIGIFLSQPMYWIFSICGLSLIYRMIMNCTTPFVVNYIHKVIQIIPNNQELLNMQKKHIDFLQSKNQITQLEYNEFMEIYSGQQMLQQHQQAMPPYSYQQPPYQNQPMPNQMYNNNQINNQIPGYNQYPQIPQIPQQQNNICYPAQQVGYDQNNINLNNQPLNQPPQNYQGQPRDPNLPNPLI